MGDIEFSREAVGVSAKKDWVDANEFARISSFISSLMTFKVAENLPVGDNSGVVSLILGLGNFNKNDGLGGVGVLRCLCSAGVWSRGSDLKL